MCLKPSLIASPCLEASAETCSCLGHMGPRILFIDGGIGVLRDVDMDRRKSERWRRRDGTPPGVKEGKGKTKWLRGHGQVHKPEPMWPHTLLRAPSLPPHPGGPRASRGWGGARGHRGPDLYVN